MTFFYSGSRRKAAAELGSESDPGPCPVRFHQATPPRLARRSGQVPSSSPIPQLTHLLHGGNAGPLHITGLFEKPGRGQGTLGIRKGDLEEQEPPLPCSSQGCRNTAWIPAPKCPFIRQASLPHGKRQGHLASGRALLVTGAHYAQGSLFQF